MRDREISKYRRIWTESDLATLRALAGTMTAGKIAARLGRTLFATHMKMRKLGLAGVHCGSQPLEPGAPRVMGTEEQQAAIRAAAGTKYAYELGRELGISPTTVRRYAERMGVRLKVLHHWTPEEDQALRESAGQGWRAAVSATGRSEDAVTGRAVLLGIKIGRPRKAAAVRPAKAVKVRVEKPAKVVKPVTVMKRVESNRPPLRQVEYRGSRIEYCPQCGAPVSNWDQHFERLGHVRTGTRG